MTESYGAVVPSRWDPAVFVAAPRTKVFDYLADPRHRPEWQASLDRVQLLDDGPPRVGMRWVDHLTVGPSFELQIIGMEPHDLWAEMGRIGPLRAFVTMLFQDEVRDGEAGTCVRIVTRVRGARLAKPVGWVATAALALLVRVDLPRLARAAAQP